MKRSYLDFMLPIAFAHRGGAELWPENTLVAFRRVMELGYRYIETDAWMTRDGYVVLFHDATLERTTNGRGRVDAYTLAELQALDAGYHFTRDGGLTHPFRGRGLRIPTLEEAFAVSPDLRFNIELKARSLWAAKALWRVIEDHRARDRVLVAAAHTPTGLTFRVIARGRVATSASYHEVLAFWLAVRSGTHRLMPITYDALQVPEVHRGIRILDRRFVTAAHARGLHVHVWTVNELSAMDRLRDLGVDGIITDRPDRLSPIVSGAAGNGVARR